MSQIDEVKETLNTLRVAMSIAFAILLFVAGTIVKRYDSGNVDIIFWVSTGFVGLILISIILVVISIRNKTKEIGRI